MVSSKGGRAGFVYANRHRAYRALKKKLGKRSAARIANAGNTFAKRSRMAKKAARSR